MKYPVNLAKANKFLAVTSGVLIFGISALAVIEVVMRNFIKPTVWTADVSCYLLIWAVFIGSGYAFQEFGHVRVDLILNFLPRRLRKIVSSLSYCVAIFFMVILGWYSYKYFYVCYNMNRKTYAMIPILQWKLVIAMVIGCAIMLITLIFIVLDILSDGEKYL